MKPEEMKVGQVVFDPKTTAVPEARAFFKVIEVHSDAGPYVLQQVGSHQRMTVKIADIGSLKLVDGAPYLKANFDALLGQRVRLKTRWGAWLSGEVQAVEYGAFVLESQQIRMPMELVLDGDRIDVREIEELHREAD